MIYVPHYNKNNTCVVITNKDTIRVYNQVPTHNSTIDYTDYYVNSHYLYNTGTQTFNQYSNLPSCIAKEELTDNVYYRTDYADCLIIFFILFIFCFYVPYRIIKRFFGRWFNV